MPAIVCLLAWMMLFLVEGIEGTAAGAARVLADAFAVAYTAFTAFGGIAIGAFVKQMGSARTSSDLPPS